MSNLEADVCYFDNILHKLKADEKYIERLYRIIQAGFIDREVSLPVEEKADENDVPDHIISEIENALSKAQLIYEKSMNPTHLNNNALKKIKRESGNNAKMEKAPSLENSRKAEVQSRIPKAKRSFNNSNSKIVLPVNRSHQRVTSEAAVLRKRAKSWLPQKQFDTFPECREITSTPKKSCSSCLYHPNLKNFNSSSTFKLNGNALQRVKDVIALSTSLDKYSEETLLALRDSEAQTDFLIYCDNLRSSDECDLDISRRYFSYNLPNLTTLFGQFMEIMNAIDWKIATPRQHQWRNGMLENFAALFSIADSFKFLLLDESEVSNANVMSENAEDSFPSMETIWKAYVCTGQNLPSSYSDPPVDVPSRGLRLTLGPTVFFNDSRSHRDFEEMFDLWSEIFHLQKRLQILDFVEKRLPQWLRSIAHLSSGKATALRLLCQIACDCFPVTIDDK